MLRKKTTKNLKVAPKATPRKSKAQPQTMAELLSQTGYPLKGFKRGDLIEGVVTSLSPREILIDVSGKSEGLVSERDFDFIADLLQALKIGDKVTAYVVTPEDESGRLILSLRKASLDHKWKVLTQVKEKGETITVRGLEVNRGGLLVDCQNLRGFIPASQIDISYLGKLQQLIGQNLEVKVLEVDQKSNRLIFSQKSVITPQDEAKIKKRLAKIKIGETEEGIVAGVTPFGVFVDLDGVEGLVHISEIAWEKINDPKDYFKVGDKVKVLVSGVEEKTSRLNLSIKRLSTDPLEKLSKLYTQEKTVKGKISKLTNFGAFVRLEEGVEGLVHISKIPAGKEFEEGEEVECLIESLDLPKRRVSLSLVLKEKPLGYK